MIPSSIRSSHFKYVIYIDNRLHFGRKLDDERNVYRKYSQDAEDETALASSSGCFGVPGIQLGTFCLFLSRNLSRTACPYMGGAFENKVTFTIANPQPAIMLDASYTAQVDQPSNRATSIAN